MDYQSDLMQVRFLGELGHSEGAEEKSKKG